MSAAVAEKKEKKKPSDPGTANGEIIRRLDGERKSETTDQQISSHPVKKRADLIFREYSSTCRAVQFHNKSLNSYSALTRFTSARVSGRPSACPSVRLRVPVSQRKRRSRRPENSSTKRNKKAPRRPFIPSPVKSTSERAPRGVISTRR